MGSALIFKGVDAAAVLFGLGKYRRALRAVQQILHKNPRNTEALILKAEILSHLGESQSALKIVNDVLARHPENYHALSSKAEICFLAGRNDEALRIFGTLGRRKKIPREERRCFYSQWINALIDNKRWLKAKRILNDALKQFPGDDLLEHYRTLLPNSGKAA